MTAGGGTASRLVLAAALAGVLGCRGRSAQPDRSGSAAVAEPPPKPESLAQRFEACRAAWNANDWHTFGECFTEHAVAESPGSGQAAAVGRAAIVKQAVTDHDAPARELRGDPWLVLVDGATVISLIALHGHTDTNKPIGIVTGVIAHFDDSRARIDHAWTYTDALTLIRQITPDPPHVARAPIDRPPRPHTVAIAAGSAGERANLETLEALLAAYAEHDANPWGALFSDDVVWSDAAEPADRDKRAVVANVAPLWQAMPNARLTATTTWAAGDYVAAAGTFSGTNDRESSLHAKTGKSTAMPFLLVAQIEHGRVTAGWMLYQSMGIADQLGWGDEQPATLTVGSGAHGGR